MSRKEAGIQIQNGLKIEHISFEQQYVCFQAYIQAFSLKGQNLMFTAADFSTWSCPNYIEVCVEVGGSPALPAEGVAFSQSDFPVVVIFS